MLYIRYVFIANVIYKICIIIDSVSYIFHYPPLPPTESSANIPIILKSRLFLLKYVALLTFSMQRNESILRHTGYQAHSDEMIFIRQCVTLIKGAYQKSSLYIKGYY